MAASAKITHRLITTPKQADSRHAHFRQAGEGNTLGLADAMNALAKTCSSRASLAVHVAAALPAAAMHRWCRLSTLHIGDLGTPRHSAGRHDRQG